MIRTAAKRFKSWLAGRLPSSSRRPVSDPQPLPGVTRSSLQPAPRRQPTARVPMQAATRKRVMNPLAFQPRSMFPRLAASSRALDETDVNVSPDYWVSRLSYLKKKLWSWCPKIFTSNSSKQGVPRFWRYDTPLSSESVCLSQRHSAGLDMSLRERRRPPASSASGGKNTHKAQSSHYGKDARPLGTVAEDAPSGGQINDKIRQLCLTGTGRLMLGLGTLGVFAAREEAGPLPFDTFESEQPFKRKLFENLNDLFGLREETGVSESERGDSDSDTVPDDTAATDGTSETSTSSGSTSSTSSGNSSSNTQRDSKRSAKRGKSSSGKSKDKLPSYAIFERLVVGDRLVLRKGDITPDQWAALSSFLVSCPHIRTLRIQGIEITEREAEELGGALQQIRHITFCDNEIGLNAGALEKLVALLLTCGLLESTSIVRNSIRDRHVPELLALLSQHSSLNRVSLSWNAIGDEGAEHIAATVRVLQNQLREIDLSYNVIGQVGIDAIKAAHEQRRELAKHEPPGNTLSSSSAPAPPSLRVRIGHQERRFEQFRSRYRQSEVFDDDDPDLPWYLEKVAGARAAAEGRGGRSKENVRAYQQWKRRHVPCAT